MGELHIIDHPLVQHKISLLRDKNTGTKEFRELVSEIAMFICYEATRDLPLKEIELETPLAVAKTKIISGRKLAFIPILRAGLGMVEGVTTLVPAAKIGHIGLFRDPVTHEPVYGVEYSHCKAACQAHCPVGVAPQDDLYKAVAEVSHKERKQQL